jgi:polyisoprenyl-teichoic acid--peptidoglycan teichoic acid transferase
MTSDPKHGDPRRRLDTLSSVGLDSTEEQAVTPSPHQHHHHHHHHHHRKRRRIIITVFVTLLVLLGALAGYAFWYSSTISDNIALDDEDQEALSAVLTPTESSTDPFYVLLVGVDTSSYLDGSDVHGSEQGSDVIILVRVDPSTHTLTMVSIPRDTPVYVDGQKVKINSLYLSGGAAATVSAVSELTGVDIAHYVRIDFAGLESYIDDIGGIYVDVPMEVTYGGVTVAAGPQVLDGAHALAFACARFSYGDNQDAKRQTNIRAITSALIDSVIDAPKTEIPGLVERFSSCVSTDMSVSFLISWAFDFAQADDVTLYTCSGPYDGAIDTDNGDLWFCYDDPAGWASLMAQVEAGEDPVTTTLSVGE